MMLSRTPSAAPRRIRVLHVAASLSTYGAERLVAALAERMPGDEFDVRVMTVYTPPRGFPERLRGRVVDIGRAGRWDLGFLPRMLRVVRAFAPDIVHTHTHNGKYWGRTAGLLAGVPAIVHTEHSGMYEREFLPAHLYNRFLHGRTTAFVGFSPGHAARIARSEGIAPEKFRVIPNGIAEEPPRYAREAVRAELGATGDRAIVLHAGRFEALKRQSLAIDAWAGSEALRRRAILALAGTGPLETALAARVAELGLDASVRFLGYRRDVPQLLGGVDIALLTSDFEAMPLAAIEAMRARVPVVTTPWEGAAEFFEGGRLGRITARYDAGEIARELLAVLDDRAGSRERSDAAHAVGHERYSVDACVAAHAQLYRSLVAS